MSIIPKIGGGNVGGLVKGAASSAAGNIGQQIKGVVNREASALSVGKITSTIGRAVDLKTGGLLTGAKELFGVAKGVTGSSIGSVVGSRNQALNSTGLPQWGSLSEHLFAVFYPCDDTGAEQTGTDGLSQSIFGPATDVQFDSTLNWQSPFENSGPESKAPTIMAMLQTGQLAYVAHALQEVIPDGAVGDFTRDLAGKAEQWARDLRGRTGITKLNSRQVFSGMPPVRITMQFHLRAVSDPIAEVVQPYEKLLEWAWPQELAANGIVSEVLTSNGSVIDAMFPSKAPQMIGWRFGNNRYGPMVIESVGNPLDGPMDKDGNPISRVVQITIATLTALDRRDVAGLFSRS